MLNATHSELFSRWAGGGLECKRIRIPWRALALTVAKSPYKGANEADWNARNELA